MSDGNFDNLTVTGSANFNSLSVGGSLGVTLPSLKLDVHGDTGVNDNQIWLRPDQNHGLGWHGAGKEFVPGSAVDGPVLFGYAGGALGSTNGGKKIALSWNSDGNGNVIVNGYLDINGPLEIHNSVVLNDKNVMLRDTYDMNHGLGWHGIGKEFAGTNVDGPVLFGCSGGALGTTNNGQKIALIWNNNGNVGIGTMDPGTRLDVNGGISCSEFKISGLYRDEDNHDEGESQLLVNIDPVSGIINFQGNNMVYPGKWPPPLTLQPQGGIVCIGAPDPSGKLEDKLHVNGHIKVTGDVFLVGADCAEEFNITGVETVEAGTVMVINEDGALAPSRQAYDKRVAGVISGAGNFRPGITLDRKEKEGNRLPLALTGKVYCKVDAQYGSVGVGDLLTTSPTRGHAMKASDDGKALGAIIGKALRPLALGQDIIPILVALQ